MFIYFPGNYLLGILAFIISSNPIFGVMFFERCPLPNQLSRLQVTNFKHQLYIY